MKKNLDIIKKFKNLQEKFFIMCGPNVIESEEHTMKMAKSLK